MRGLTFSSTTLALLTILSHAPLSQPFPFPIHFSERTEVVQRLAGRSSCANPCGYYKQLCCLESEECYTDESQQAACRAKTITPRQDGGHWSKWTTTYVQTDFQTITSTGSTWVSGPTPNGNIQCDLTLGQSPCGSICCTAAQQCQANVCVPAGGSPIGNTPTPTPTQPLLPTSSGMTTITAKPTTTVPFIPPVGTDGSSLGSEPAHQGGLSGGAIAGIVVGVIAGVIFLLLLCCLCCAKGLLDSVLAIFGIGKKKRRHSSYTSSSSSSHNHGGWFGGGGHHSDSSSEKKGGFLGMGKWASAAVILGAIAVCLGLRRKKKERRSEKNSSYYGSSYTYSSDYSTSSSPSSRSTPPPPRTHTRTYSRTYSRHRSRSRR